jgi:hypothetical protein
MSSHILIIHTKFTEHSLEIALSRQHQHAAVPVTSTMSSGALAVTTAPSSDITAAHFFTGQTE